MSVISQFQTFTLEEAANGYCLAMANAFRLIEDGEKLSEQRRFVGAIGCFSASTHEIIKGHLISQALLIPESDDSGWTIWWETFRNPDLRLAALEREIHPEMFRNADAQAAYKKGFDVIRMNFVEMRFDESSGRFLPPGGDLVQTRADAEMAKRAYEYVMGLFHAFNFYGLPNPQAQAQTFWALRAGQPGL